MKQHTPLYYIGLDIGSTTVKALVIDPDTGNIVWRKYRRHETKQPEKVLEFLREIHELLGDTTETFRIFVTGSGGNTLSSYLGARFVQEVLAVTLAVEKMHPSAGSVIELGGQDAKIIIFKDDTSTGRKKKIPSMNDKCAGGTGAVIDKINAKLRMTPGELSEAGYEGVKLHAVAGKCGVFAETDINGLQKQGVPANELMASLFESIVQQNLSVLTRGHTLRPEVLLLGGPNSFIRGMVECWRANITRLWQDRRVSLPNGVEPGDLIYVPENAEYYGALGAIEFGRQNDEEVVEYRGIEPLVSFINVGRDEIKKRSGLPPLISDQTELEQFRNQYAVKPFMPLKINGQRHFRAFLGVDGGSTSTKGVLLDLKRRVAFKSYQLSNGNPIEDTVQIIDDLHQQVKRQHGDLEIIAAGTTGYAKDILRKTIGADVALVETVAHTQAALHFHQNVDVICDVGGQDIKLIVLKDNRVSDFKLNTQCSAGNGYFLQSTAEGFGYSVDDYAEIAFSAKSLPEFGYGCAVFMQTDIVDFQRQGWQPNEILAGLAVVLPKNIWLYVSQIPNITELGTHFILQGGTQRNLAAVKAQVDFINERFRKSGLKPLIRVHEHTGEAGAIGCALEAARIHSEGHVSSFIGLDAVAGIKYKTTRNEATRCFFCKNNCMRTFIDIETTEPAQEDTASFDYKYGPEAVRSARFETAYEQSHNPASAVPLNPGANRLIIATCEKGAVEDVDDMRAIARSINEIRKLHPNLLDEHARLAWKATNPEPAYPSSPKFFAGRARQKWEQRRLERSRIRVGVPRVLNLYSFMPFFSAWFESLGIPHENIVFSDFTNETMYKEGSRRGSIDPCYPSKVALAHVHNLLFKKHTGTPFHWLFFPIIDEFPTDLHDVLASRACPTATGTTESVKAAFLKEEDTFRRVGVDYLNPFICLSDPHLCARQMYECFHEKLNLSKDETLRAVEAGFAALTAFHEKLRSEGRRVIDRLERENRLGITVLGRPYHCDPGINHSLLEGLQRLGYPILSQDTLPTDDEMLQRLFGDEVMAGSLRHPMDISDVWKNAYSENTSRKIWAAKFVARHPNLVALELSSFKCGHDAPIYSLIQEIVERSGTPYFSFKDIDENKPAGSLKIRIETIAYFLDRYRSEIFPQKPADDSVDARLRQYAEETKSTLNDGASILQQAGVQAVDRRLASADSGTGHRNPHNP